MRLWSLHPQYLDARGLVACWREALLAKAVLAGRTKGYRRHPQLARFRMHRRPLQALDRYLSGLYDEATRRGYAFDKRKVGRRQAGPGMTVTSGQMRYEMSHLKRKLKQRDRRAYRLLQNVKSPRPHPLFRIVEGSVEPWERPGSGRQVNGGA